MPKIKDAKAVVRTYTCPKTNKEKNVWMKVGSLFESDKGLSLQLDLMPVGPEFTGWIKFFDPYEDREQNYAEGMKVVKSQLEPIAEDDIPF
jgi:hypothetical protein